MSRLKKVPENEKEFTKEAELRGDALNEIIEMLNAADKNLNLDAKKISMMHGFADNSNMISRTIKGETIRRFGFTKSACIYFLYKANELYGRVEYHKLLNGDYHKKESIFNRVSEVKDVDNSILCNVLSFIKHNDEYLKEELKRNEQAVKDIISKIDHKIYFYIHQLLTGDEEYNPEINYSQIDFIKLMGRLSEDENFYKCFMDIKHFENKKDKS